MRWVVAALLLVGLFLGTTKRIPELERPMNERGLVSSLFDLSFSNFITPKIQKFLYALLLIMSGVVALGVLVTAFGMAGGFFGKIGAVLIGVPAAALCFLLMAMYFRVMMEILIVVFRAVEHLQEIATAVKASGKS